MSHDRVGLVAQAAEFLYSNKESRFKVRTFGSIYFIVKGLLSVDNLETLRLCLRIYVPVKIINPNYYLPVSTPWKHDVEKAWLRASPLLQPVSDIVYKFET
jgi:hypothetical protein